MKIAIKKSDFHKIDINEIKEAFKAFPIAEMGYAPSELAKQLDEVIFEFNYLNKEIFLEYLKIRSVTGRIF